MISWKLILLLVGGYAVIFFLISLWETKDIKEAFYAWINTMLEWRDHAVPGILFILILALLGYIIGKGTV